MDRTVMDRTASSGEILLQGFFRFLKREGFTSWRLASYQAWKGSRGEAKLTWPNHLLGILLLAGGNFGLPGNLKTITGGCGKLIDSS